MGGDDVAVPVEEYEGGRNRGEQVRGGLRTGFARVTEQLGDRVGLQAEGRAYGGGLGQAAAAVSARRAQLGRAQQRGHGTDRIGAPQDPLRRLFEQARDLLVRLDGRFTQMPGAAFGLIRQLGGQRPVGPAAVAAGGQLDDRGPGQRVAEDQPPGAFANPHQPGLLRGGEIIDVLLPGRCVQQAHVSAALQYREQQQATGRFGKIRGPGCE